MQISFLEFINRQYASFKDTTCLGRDITLQITEDCTCQCSYCYQINKSPKQMSIETAKKILDLIFQMKTDQDTTRFINKDTPGLVINFIGGEPLMNIEVIDFVCNYFLITCLKNNYEDWLLQTKFSICSNGDLYFNKKVQEVLNKYQDFLSITITIDGPQELHDECRKCKNGQGNFNNAFKAAQSAKIKETKITISKENLDKLHGIAQFFYNNKYKSLYANPIYERMWSIEDGQIFYQELKQIANDILNYSDFEISLFNKDFFQPLKADDLQNWCGAEGKMLAFDPDGNAYPCLRFMSSSLGENISPIIIGNVNDGIYNTLETKKIQETFQKINRKTKSTSFCFKCPIATGCSTCAAYDYQYYGFLGKRTTNICNMFKAQSLANVYYWNKFYEQNNIDKKFKMYLPKEEALKFIDEDEYNMLYALQDDKKGNEI